MQVIRFVWFAVEVALKAAGPIGVWVVAITPGPIVEKVSAWYNFPSEIAKRINTVPREIENAEYLIWLANDVEKLQSSDANWIEKGYELLAFSKNHFWDITKKLPEIADEQIKKSRDLMTLKNNIVHMPLETMESMIIVLMSCLILAHMIRFFRIWDGDTFFDMGRKKAYRKVNWRSDPDKFVREISGYFEDNFWRTPTEEEIMTLLEDAIRARKKKTWG